MAAASAEHVQMLMSMFPGVEPSVITSVIESSGNDDIESAVEALLGITAAASTGPEHSLDVAVPDSSNDTLADVGNRLVARSEQQIAEDEELAHQLQQQLFMEDQVFQQQEAQQQAQLQRYGVANQSQFGAYQNYPGTGVAGQQQQQRYTYQPSRTANAADDGEFALLPSGLLSLGSAVYSAGAATMDTASSLVSSLWSWGTSEPTPRPDTSTRAPRGPNGLPSAHEHGPEPDAEETRVIGHGSIDHTESGTVGEMRRRPRRSTKMD